MELLRRVLGHELRAQRAAARAAPCARSPARPGSPSATSPRSSVARRKPAASCSPSICSALDLPLSQVLSSVSDEFALVELAECCVDGPGRLRRLTCAAHVGRRPSLGTSLARGQCDGSSASRRPRRSVAQRRQAGHPRHHDERHRHPRRGGEGHGLQPLPHQGRGLGRAPRRGGRPRGRGHRRPRDDLPVRWRLSPTTSPSTRRGRRWPSVSPTCSQARGRGARRRALPQPYGRGARADRSHRPVPTRWTSCCARRRRSCLHPAADRSDGRWRSGSRLAFAPDESDGRRPAESPWSRNRCDLADGALGAGRSSERRWLGWS